MAVAVATPSIPNQMSPVATQAAQDALLDALLSSCEKQVTKPLASFGRDLKPYFPTAEAPAGDSSRPPSTQKKASRTKPTLQPVASAAAAAAASIKQTDATRVNTKATAGGKKLAVNRAKASPPKRADAGSLTVPSTSSANTKDLLPMNSGEMAAILSWAGPGFYVAPSPDRLPLPTTLLLD